MLMATRKTATVARRPAATLAAARANIERVDREIVRLLGERLAVAGAVAAAKRAAGLPVLDPHQEARVVRRAAEWARKSAVPDEDVRALFWRILHMTRNAQVDGP